MGLEPVALCAAMTVAKGGMASTFGWVAWRSFECWDGDSDTGLGRGGRRPRFAPGSGDISRSPMSLQERSAWSAAATLGGRADMWLILPQRAQLEVSDIWVLCGRHRDRADSSVTPRSLRLTHSPAMRHAGMRIAGHAQLHTVLVQWAVHAVQPTVTCANNL